MFDWLYGGLSEVLGHVPPDDYAYNLEDDPLELPIDIEDIECNDPDCEVC